MAREEAPAQGSGPVLRYSKSYRYAVKQHERMEKQQINSDFAATSTEGPEKREERPLPPGYVCNRCGYSDHWYWNCPTIDDPDHTRKVRTAKGIPRWYLTKVKDVEEAQARSLGGITLVIPGNLTHYIWTHNPDKQEHRDRVGDTVQAKVVTAFSDGAKQVEESLKCPLCRRLFRSAILAPCCGASFCSECAIERLCHNGASDSCCPKCKKELLAHQLVPNQDLRNQVDAVLRASTGKKHIEEKLQIDTIHIAPKRTCAEAPPTSLAASSLPETPISLPSHTHNQLVLSLKSKLRAIPQHIPESPQIPHVQLAQDPPAPDVNVAVERPADLAPPPILTIPQIAPASVADEWAEVMDFLSLTPTPRDDVSPVECEVVEFSQSRKRGVGAEESPTKRLCNEKKPAEPMSRREFKKCKQAWATYNEKLARKEQRRTNREERERKRAKKKK